MGEPLKAVTLPQPAATLVALRHKQILTFAWGTRYRGRLAIHAGPELVPRLEDLDLSEIQLRLLLLQAFRCETFEELYPVLKDLPRNAVVATCELVDVVPSHGPARHISPIEAAFGDFDAGHRLWFVDKIVPLAQADPAEGRTSGLWDWKQSR